MLNIAVIGAGKLGEFHIKLLKTSTKFNLVGFHEKNKERLNEISSKYEIKNYSLENISSKVPKKQSSRSSGKNSNMTLRRKK